MSSQKSIWNKGDALLLEGNPNKNFSRLFFHYSNLALNRFRWENLPPGLESRHIEHALYSTGVAVFFKEPGTETLRCLPCTYCMEKNIYGEPVGVIAHGHDVQYTLKIDDCVIIRDNDMEVAPLTHIYHYAELIDETENTIFTNLEQQRFPFIVPVTKENEQSMKTLMTQVSDNNQHIFVDKTLTENVNKGEGIDGIKVLNTGVPYLLDKLSVTKHDFENDLFTFLGINNTNTDKKERMLVDEINVNNGNILMSLDLGYKNRELSRKELNKKWSYNVELVKVIDELSVSFKGSEDNEKDTE